MQKFKETSPSEKINSESNPNHKNWPIKQQKTQRGMQPGVGTFSKRAVKSEKLFSNSLMCNLACVCSKQLKVSLCGKL